MTDDELEVKLTSLENLVEKMDEQIGDLGDGLGFLLWDLHSAIELDPQRLETIVRVWLATSFAQTVMNATESDYMSLSPELKKLNTKLPLHLRKGYWD